MSEPVLIAGRWRGADATQTFHAHNPATKQPLDVEYPISSWADCDAALESAYEAARIMRQSPPEQIASFLADYADRIEARGDELVRMANLETALASKPRLADVELPRTTSQLRQAAAAAREGSWRRPVIDTAANIRSCYASIGPVCVMGPNNFPFAFGSVSGGDFAAAIAAGNPVIGKANSSHPGTTCLLAREAHAAAQAAGLPAGTIQLLYRLDHRDGQRLVADPRLGATGYTGSRAAGLKLKAAADAAGKPIYLELSSVNPVVILPGALRERGEQIIDEFATSALMGTGQFCTNPGITVMLRGSETEAFLTSVARKYQSAPVGTLLSASVEKSLCDNIGKLVGAGATPVAGGTAGGGSGYSFSNTLLSVSGVRFLAEPEMLQTEAFGNAGLVIVADDAEQAGRILEHMEGSLTGCIYSDSRGSEDTVYEQLSQILRPLVGRLLNDKMPTGVAVSPAMNHGGPYPATAHPGFTAVGIPAALSRFATLRCYDNVRQRRLPACLADKNPNGIMWRQIDGCWTQGDVGG